MPSFFDTVTAAINDTIEFGYESEERLEYWVDQIRQAAEADMVSEAELTANLQRVLGATYRRLIEKGSVLARHEGVGKFTLAQIEPALRAELDRRILAAANLIKLNREQAIADTLRRFQGWSTSIPAGGTEVADRREIKQAIRKELTSLPFKERRVMIDQGHKLSSAISDIVAQANDAIAAEWRSHWRQSGYDYREDHKERDGVVYALKDGWAVTEGFIKPGKQGFYEDHERPGEFVFCLPGETRIPFADGVEVAYRRRYSGQLTELVTNSGKTLRATPNHPILAAHGWAAMQALKEGDYVVEIAEQVVDGPKPHQYQTEPSIAEIFGALHEAGVRERRSGSCEQFHGDGREGDIDIVRANRPLTFGSYASANQPLDQFKLAQAAHLGPTVRAAIGLYLRYALAAARSVGGLDAGLMLLRTFVLGHQGVCVPLIAGNATGLLDMSDDHRTRHTQTLGQRQDALSSIVRGTDRRGIEDYLVAHGLRTQLGRVAQVRQRQFDGHVFNLQTTRGMYISQGIISHNCRCYVKWLYALRDVPKDMLTEKGKQALAAARAKIKEVA